jgi:hypothetical protein
MRLFGVLGLIAIVEAMAPLSASATSITITGNTTFTVDWLYSPTNPDLTASATFTISDWSSTGFNLAVSDIENTMPASPDIDARLTSFGFGLTPNATGFADITDGDVFSWGFSNFPGFKEVDLCGYAGNNCAGGGNGGLDQGESTAPDDIMSITVLGSFTNGVTFDPVAAKFQTAVGSFEFDSSLRCLGENCTPTPVPEPASLTLLGSGLLLAAARYRRRKR